MLLWEKAAAAAASSKAWTEGPSGPIPLRGEAGARDAGKLRSEGKEYVVRDGDVMNFRFNV